MHRRQLPIHQPCDQDFEAMRGTAKRRRCEACDHHVHDLSRLTEAEAVVLVKRPGRVCVRYRVGPDGLIRFKPTRRTAPAVFVAALSLALAACAAHGEPEVLEGPEEAMVCRDASGYAIDCDLWSEPVIPDQPAPTESEPEREPETEPEPEPEPVFEDDEWILGFVE